MSTDPTLEAALERALASGANVEDLLILSSAPIDTFGLIPVRVSKLVPPGTAYLINNPPIRERMRHHTLGYFNEVASRSPRFRGVMVTGLSSRERQEEQGEQDAGVVEGVPPPNLVLERRGAQDPADERGQEQEQQADHEHGSPRFSPGPHVNRECWDEA